MNKFMSEFDLKRSARRFKIEYSNTVSNTDGIVIYVIELKPLSGNM